MELNKNVGNHKQENIPAWMLEKNGITIADNKSAKTSFLTKTIKEFSSIIQNEVYSEKFVQCKGYLQMIDPRIKFLTLLFYMIFCATTKSLATLVLLAFVAICFVMLSQLKLKNYFKRVWLIIPLLVFVFSIPAASNLIIKGTPIFYIYRSLDLRIGMIKFPEELYFSYLGMQIIIKMALRIGVSISFAYLLIMTTRWHHITKTFSAIKVPTLIISILNMAYRYIFIISKIASETMEARFLRTIQSQKNKLGRMFIANRMSFLFIKASFLSDEIYDAMRCRGYAGEVVSLCSLKIKMIDILWIFSNLAILFVLVMGELL